MVSMLVMRKRYYVYVNSLANVDLMPCGVPDLQFESIEMPITLAQYELLAHSGQDPRQWHLAPSSDNATPKSFVFVTTSHGTLVNVTGMTVTRQGSVYSQIHTFWPPFREDRSTLYAGYSETAADYRRKGVYTWVHGMIFSWAERNGFERVILLEGEDQPGPRSSQDKLGSSVVAETCHVTLFSGLRSRYRAHVWVTNPCVMRLLRASRS
jgi:hypothetical protein